VIGTRIAIARSTVAASSDKHNAVLPVTPGMVCERAMDELAADDHPIGLSEEFVDSGQLHAEYRRQVAVRRVGTLVVRGGEPSELVGAVADEMRGCAGAFTAGIWRFDTSDEITLVAGVDAAALAKWAVGARTPIDSDTLATVVYGTGLPARIDSYENIAGSIAARVRAVGVRAAVGVLIIVDGSFSASVPDCCVARGASH
jgi:hypothetical protein